MLKEAARYARLLGAPLLVVHVDVTRFVTYEDPDGYVHSAPIDMNIAAGDGDLAAVHRRRPHRSTATISTGASGSSSEIPRSR